MMQNQREPFFKPLNVESGSYEVSSKSQRSRQKQMTNEKARQQEDVDVSDEKLTFLHVKLHQEADKIRKWKNQTEYDLKQKDLKIHEATQTIDSLRKSILDLQLQNESLSLTLQEEISNQQEIVQSVSATRNLCAVLKDHMSRADAKITDCEAEKTELRYLEREHKQQFEDLTNKFRDLEQCRRDEKIQLETELSTLKEENVKMVEDLQTQIKNAEQELMELQGKCDEKDIEIRDIRKEVQKNQEQIHTYEKTIDMLREDLKSKEEEIAGSKEQYEKSCKLYETVESTRCEVEEKLRVKESEIESLENKYSALQIDHEASREGHTQQQLQTQQKLEESKQQLQEQDQRMQNLEKDLDKTMLMLEEVRCSKDVLIMEKAALEERLHELEAQNDQLLSQHEQNCQIINKMSSTITDLQTQLATSQEEGAAIMLQLNEVRAQMSCMETEKLEFGERMKMFETEMTTKKSSLEELQRELCEKSVLIHQQELALQNVQQSLHAERDDHEQTKARLVAVENKLSKAQEQLISKAEEMGVLQKEMDTLSKQNKTLEKNLEKSETYEKTLRDGVSQLQSELDQQREANDSLMEEKEKYDEAIQGQLQSKEKATSDLESKNKSLKSDIAAKNKHVKELEKEVKSLKTKISSMTKTVDGQDQKLNKLQSQLESEEIEKEKLMEQLQKLEELLQEAREQFEIANKKSVELKVLADKCVAEKEDMVCQCEQMRTEMSNIMQNYKTENDRLVIKKDQEISALKAEMAKAKEHAVKEIENELKSLQNDNERLRNSISQSGHQMENLQKTYGMKENEVLELRKENLEKNEELKDLQKQLEQMYIKTSAKTTTTIVQTSPFPDKSYQAPSRNPCTTPRVPPKTPQVSSAGPSGDNMRTPLLKQAPRTPRTPTTDLKTPQRSILKNLAMNSASKKRRVVFATWDDGGESVSSESSTFEVLETTDEKCKSGLGTPLLIKPSPRTPSSNKTNADSVAMSPLTRKPRGPPVNLEKKKSKKDSSSGKENTDIYSCDDTQMLMTEDKSKKKDKGSSVRKAPKKEGGKFFKTSPKSKLSKLREKEGMSWFESDDIFGFGAED